MAKILIVEDDKIMLKTLEFKLEKEGYEIVKAEDGRVASQLIEEQEFDLVITDIMMPFITGLELVDIIKNKIQQNTKIIVLSSVGQEDTVLQAFELGADDFMSKPFSPNELNMRVKKLLLRP